MRGFLLAIYFRTVAHKIQLYTRVLSESFWTVVVTASVKEDEGGKVTIPQVYCISLPRDTAL
jgi:hypothetical protein